MLLSYCVVLHSPVPIPCDLGDDPLDELDHGELGRDARVDAGRRLSDVEPNARADQDAEKGVTPVDQEHQDQLHQKLRGQKSAMKFLLL